MERRFRRLKQQKYRNVLSPELRRVTSDDRCNMHLRIDEAVNYLTCMTPIPMIMMIILYNKLAE